MCPSPMSPSRWAAAVWLSSCGASGSPVSARRGPKIGGLADTPAGLGLGDPQPVSQRAAQRAAQLFLAGLRLELVDQRVLGCAQPTRDPFEALQRPQPFRGGEHVKRQLTQTVQVAIKRVENLHDLLATTATHTPNSTKTHRQKQPDCDYVKPKWHKGLQRPTRWPVR